MQGKKEFNKYSGGVPALLTGDSIIDVKRIELIGLDRTTLSFFERELKDARVITRGSQASLSLEQNAIIIKDSSTNTNEKINLSELLQKDRHHPTLRNVHSALHQFTAKMVAADLFEFVDTNLQIEDGSSDRFSATVKITLKEKGIPFLRAQTFIKAGAETDSGVELMGALRNPTGHGETIKVGTVGKPTGGQEYVLNLSIPHIGEINGPLSLTLKSSEENQSYYSSFKQQLTSFLAEYTHDAQGRHQITAEYSIRDEIPMLRTDLKPHASVFGSVATATADPTQQRHASPAILSSALSSVKTSLKYVWNAVDTRDSIGNPTTGEFLQTSVEVALPPGNAQFLKADVSSQFHRQLGPKYLDQPGLTLSVMGSLGMMTPLSVLFPSFYYQKNTLQTSTSPLTSFLSDRYHLGGPLSLRGFDTAGAGPKSHSTMLSNIGQSTDSLGGDAKSSLLAFLSVPVPIPMLAEASMRAFWFVNAGSLGNSNYWKVRLLERLAGSNHPVVSEWKGKASPLFGYMRASIGSGISVCFQNSIRLEATYSIPVFASQTDRYKAFQLGVGLSIN